MRHLFIGTLYWKGMLLEDITSQRTQKVGYLWAGWRADGFAGGTLRLAAGCQSPRQDVPCAAAWQQRYA